MNIEKMSFLDIHIDLDKFQNLIRSFKKDNIGLQNLQT